MRSPDPHGSKNRVFFGWWIVAVAMVGECLCHGSLVVYTFGCFLKPLAREFGTNRGQTALALSLGNLALVFSLPAAGRVADWLGTRPVLLGCVAGLGGGLICLARIAPPLWHLYLIFILIGIIGAGVGPVTYQRVVANWFDRRRGLALGLTAMGLGFGTFLMPALAQAVIDRWGWRPAYAIFGGLCLVVALPLVARFFKERPEAMGLRADGDEAGRPAREIGAPVAGMTVAEALRLPIFWQLCFIVAGISASVVGTTLHLVPLLTDRGMPARSAALVVSVFGLATMVSRGLNGLLIDRWFAPRVMAIFTTGATVGLLIFWRGIGGGAPYGAALLLGLGLGAETDIMPYLVSRYFGLRAMGALYGTVFGFHVLGAAAGGYLLGVGFDATGSYRLPLACAAGVLVFAIVATLALGPYHASVPSRPAAGALGPVEP